LLLLLSLSIIIVVVVIILVIIVVCRWSEYEWDACQHVRWFTWRLLPCNCHRDPDAVHPWSIFVSASQDSRSGNHIHLQEPRLQVHSIPLPSCASISARHPRIWSHL